MVLIKNLWWNLLDRSSIINFSFKNSTFLTFVYSSSRNSSNSRRRRRRRRRRSHGSSSEASVASSGPTQKRNSPLELGNGGISNGLAVPVDVHGR
uniref:Uncharacterized protein MANES_12G107400 n=1 Tax=Rhizophora mucronata TaxID=61149 RepID=A0A2P2M7D6_RHIMU